MNQNYSAKIFVLLCLFVFPYHLHAERMVYIYLQNKTAEPILSTHDDNVIKIYPGKTEKFGSQIRTPRDKGDESATQKSLHHNKDAELLPTYGYSGSDAHYVVPLKQRYTLSLPRLREPVTIEVVTTSKASYYNGGRGSVWYRRYELQWTVGTASQPWVGDRATKQSATRYQQEGTDKIYIIKGAKKGLDLHGSAAADIHFTIEQE